MNNNIGEFIKNEVAKYLSNNKQVKKSELIRKFGITTQYLNDIENNKRVPSSDLMKKMILILKLNNDEKITMFDLACDSHKGKKVPADIEDFIINNKDARKQIRDLISKMEEK